jgi:hypothetical protein
LKGGVTLHFLPRELLKLIKSFRQKIDALFGAEQDNGKKYSKRKKKVKKTLLNLINYNNNLNIEQKDLIKLITAREFVPLGKAVLL